MLFYKLEKRSRLRRIYHYYYSNKYNIVILMISDRIILCDHR